MPGTFWCESYFDLIKSEITGAVHHSKSGPCISPFRVAQDGVRKLVIQRLLQQRNVGHAGAAGAHTLIRLVGLAPLLHQTGESELELRHVVRG